MKKSFLLVAFLSTTMLSCTKQKAFSVDLTTVSVDRILGTWRMLRYQDAVTNEDVQTPSDALLGEMRITFNADGTANARFNCNSASFTFSIVDNKLVLTGGSMTLVGCDSTWVDNFFKVFNNPTNTPFISVSSRTLALTSEDLLRKITFNKI